MQQRRNSGGNRVSCTGRLEWLDETIQEEDAMIRILGSSRRTRDGLTRRETLRAGGLSMLGGMFGLPQQIAAAAGTNAAENGRKRPGKAKSVIMLYLLGGAPTQDMFDMKPDAPDGLGGEFNPIA